MPKLRNQLGPISAVAAALTGIALSQTLGGAVAVNLNGAGVQTGQIIPGNAAPVTNPGGPYASGQVLVPSSGLPLLGSAAVLTPAQQVVVTSAGNDTGINFTIVGADYAGNTISEVLTGGNGATVATSKFQYSAVYSITSSGATAAAITIGTGGIVLSPWLIIGAQRNEFNYQIRTFLSPGGTANYDIQATSDINLMNQTGGFADDIDTVAAAQTGNTSNYPVAPWEAFRLKINSGGPVILRAMENRTA